MADGATGSRAPTVVWALVGAILAAHAAFTLAPQAARGRVDEAFALIPARFHGESPYAFQHWYEPLGAIFGHAFLHVAWWHAGLNAFFLFMLGRLPAARLGPWRFLLLYFASIAAGALAFLAINWSGRGIAIGASGAVCGVFTAYYMALRPHWRQALAAPAIRNQWLMLFFINVVVMGVLSGAGVFAIAWEAHLGGFIAGGLAYALLAPPPKVFAGPWGGGA